MVTLETLIFMFKELVMVNLIVSISSIESMLQALPQQLDPSEEEPNSQLQDQTFLLINWKIMFS